MKLPIVLLDLIRSAEQFVVWVCKSKFTSLILFLPDGVHLCYYAIGEWNECEASSLQDSTGVQAITLNAILKIPSRAQSSAIIGVTNKASVSSVVCF